MAPDELVVLHVGRMAAEKNLGTLVEAYEALRQLQDAIPPTSENTPATAVDPTL